MKPHTSCNKIAAFMTARTPERRLAIVRGAKKSAGLSFPPYYTSFKGPARRFGASGWDDPSELRELVARMATRRGSKWLNIDSQVTSDAAKALIAAAPKLQSVGATFSLPPSGMKALLEFPELDVTATPDLIVHGERGPAPLVGGFRFFLAKEASYQLGALGAQVVAELQYIWLVRTADGRRAPDSGLCMVLECFQGRLTAAPADPHLEKAIRKACVEFARLWHLLDDKEAA